MNTAITSIITDYLSRPMEITPEIESFAESSLDVSDPEELIAFLAGDEAENSGLLEILLHPPDSLRQTLEEHIRPSGIPPEEQNIIIDFLMKEVKGITLREPETGTTGALTPTRTILKEFLAALRLSTALPAAFDEEGGSDPGIPAALRCELRRHWHRLTPASKNEILALTEALTEDKSPAGEAAAVISAAAEILGNISDKDDPYEIISRQKQNCEKLIDTINHFEEMQRRYSMDILMSMRLTPPAENYDYLMQKIIMLDRISFLLYNIPARGRPPERNVSMDLNKLDL